MLGCLTGRYVPVVTTRGAVAGKLWPMGQRTRHMMTNAATENELSRAGRLMAAHVEKIEQLSAENSRLSAENAKLRNQLDAADSKIARLTGSRDGGE